MQTIPKPEATSVASTWIRTLRPKTLTTAIVPFCAGTALASSLGFTVDWALFIFALISALCIHTAVNLINDAYDAKKGADTSERLGPQRAIQAGLATPGQVLLAGLAMLMLALISSIPLIVHGGALILYIVLLSMLSAYTYTGGPFPLGYNGLGDFFVIVFYGWVSTMAAFWLQAGGINALSFLLGTQIGLLSTTLIAINNLRDIEGDTKVGKRTLPVRFGQSFGRGEIAVTVLLPFLLNFFWFFSGYTFASALPWLLFPVAVVLLAKIYDTPPSSAYNDFFGLAGLLHLGFGALLILGFWIH